MLRSDLLIPLPLDLFLDYDDTAGVDCDQTPADVGVFHVPFKCEVVRAQLNITETCAGADATPVTKFDLQARKTRAIVRKYPGSGLKKTRPSISGAGI